MLQIKILSTSSQSNTKSTKHTRNIYDTFSCHQTETHACKLVTKIPDFQIIYNSYNSCENSLLLK